MSSKGGKPLRHFVLICFLMYGALGQAAIYGPDHRRDISRALPQWQKAAQAVAVSLPTHYLKELDSDHFFHEEHDLRPYAETVGLCKNEKFANQKSFGHCTSFLIHPKVLISAGHCLLPTGTIENEAHSYCENFSFWFGYNDLNNPIDTLGSIIPKRDVAHCKRVIYAENNQQTEPEDNPIDFVIFELDKPITHIPHLKVSLKELRKGQTVATIGHPQGLPAKYSGQSRTLENYNTTLSAYLDTLSGNSGGPAFNAQAEVVGILISGHQFDTYKDKKNNCDRLNRCSNNGKNCDVATELENSNLLMKSQIWYPIVEEYLSGTPTS